MIRALLAHARLWLPCKAQDVEPDPQPWNYSGPQEAYRGVFIEDETARAQALDAKEIGK